MLCFNFLKLNSDFEINGLSLENSVSSEFSTLEDYTQSVVTKPNEEARLVVINVLPLVLRIALNCVLLDPKDSRKVKTHQTNYNRRFIMNFSLQE
jgi:hypothetical protein